MKNLKLLTTLAVAILLSLSLSITFSSCSSDDDDAPALVPNEPGKIPGLGREDGDLTGTQFELPAELELEVNITGYEGSYPPLKTENQKQDLEAVETKFSAFLKDARVTYGVDTVVGCGRNVELFLSIKNKSNRDVHYTFPAGLIIKSNSGRYQNGVLLKKTSVIFPANTSTRVALLMFCGNASKGSSSDSETYSWGVVSNSSLILDLCERLKNKKINYEEFRSVDNDYSYQAGRLQDILWSLTDYGNPLSESQIKYIDSLPNSI